MHKIVLIGAFSRAKNRAVDRFCFFRKYSIVLHYCCVLLLIACSNDVQRSFMKCFACEERGGKIEKERLSQGALVEELELKQDMHLV